MKIYKKLSLIFVLCAAISNIELRADETVCVEQPLSKKKVKKSRMGIWLKKTARGIDRRLSAMGVKKQVRLGATTVFVFGAALISLVVVSKRSNRRGLLGDSSPTEPTWKQLLIVEGQEYPFVLLDSPTVINPGVTKPDIDYAPNTVFQAFGSQNNNSKLGYFQLNDTNTFVEISTPPANSILVSRCSDERPDVLVEIFGAEVASPFPSALSQLPDSSDLLTTSSSPLFPPLLTPSIDLVHDDQFTPATPPHSPAGSRCVFSGSQSPELRKIVPRGRHDENGRPLAFIGRVFNYLSDFSRSVSTS